jgi:hypothetical protein
LKSRVVKAHERNIKCNASFKIKKGKKRKQKKREEKKKEKIGKKVR